MEESQLALHHPFTLLIAGPTGSGKTSFVSACVERMQASQYFDTPPQQLVWMCNERQPLHEDIEIMAQRQGVKMTFVESMKEVPIPEQSVTPTWLVIDDLLGDNTKEEEMEVQRWFTKKSHHRNTSVFYLTQNLFAQSPQHRTISLNAHYLVLFKNPRDASQVDSLARQVFPTQIPFLREAYEDATRRPYSYLFLDLKPTTDQNHRVRAHLFQDPTVLYVPKNA